MKLIKPSYKIETPINGEEILKLIERAGRTAYKSEGKIEYEDDDNAPFAAIKDYYAKSARPFIQKLIKNGHEAVLELGGMINVRFICDRGVTHEIVRHRLASFVQESTRYCNYTNGEDIEFIIPNWCNLEEQILRDDANIDPEYIIAGIHLTDDTGKAVTFSKNDSGTTLWLVSMILAETHYNYLIKRDNWSPQQARSILPNSLKTEIVVGANIREWRHIFKLRTAKGAHPQMRELMCPLLDEFKLLIPIIFDDITYD